MIIRDHIPKNQIDELKKELDNENIKNAVKDVLERLLTHHDAVESNYKSIVFFSLTSDGQLQIEIMQRTRKYYHDTETLTVDIDQADIAILYGLKQGGIL